MGNSACQLDSDECSPPGGKIILGYCNTHYKRLWRHGDPSVKLKNFGEVQRWIEAHVADPPDTDDCITAWPFHRHNGYAVAWNSRTKRKEQAVRVIWEMHTGEPFPDGLEARHLCGHGDQGCVNMRHVVPDTHPNNEGDKIIHGTRVRGERHSMAVLTEPQVRCIKARARIGRTSQRGLAAEYGINQCHVSDIKLGRRWSHLGPALYVSK